MGETKFAEGGGQYWTATNSATGASALSNIPETSWNDIEPRSFFLPRTYRVAEAGSETL
jgi:hypothetical protein